MRWADPWLWGITLLWIKALQQRPTHVRFQGLNQATAASAQGVHRSKRQRQPSQTCRTIVLGLRRHFAHNGQFLQAVLGAW